MNILLRLLCVVPLVVSIVHAEADQERILPGKGMNGWYKGMSNSEKSNSEKSYGKMNWKVDDWKGKGMGGKGMGGMWKKKKKKKGSQKSVKSKKWYKGNKGKRNKGYKGYKGYKGKGKGIISPTFSPAPSPPTSPTLPVTCEAASIGVQEIRMVEAFTGTPLGITLTDGLTVDQADIGTSLISVQCVTFPEDVVASVILTDDVLGGNRTDNSEPWILAEDSNVPFSPTNFQDNPGIWTITCQPFCGLDATGETSGAASVTFEYVISTGRRLQ